MGEFDELVSRHGVLVAGRLGPDWRVAEHKSSGLFIEVPQVFEMMTSFCCVDPNDAQHDGARHDAR